MNITQYLKEDRISLEVTARDKEKAIREIAEALNGAEEITDFNGFVKDVFEREDIDSTGIGDGIALPHARTDAVKDFVVAFGRSKEGIDFNSVDGKPVKLIFLTGTPNKKGLTQYMRFLARLARLLHKESFREALNSANSATEIIAEFRKAES